MSNCHNPYKNFDAKVGRKEAKEGKRRREDRGKEERRMIFYN